MTEHLARTVMRGPDASRVVETDFGYLGFARLASMGMYLVCKAIHENIDIKVLLTGEISDELFGYRYTDFAPSAAEFQKEAAKRIRELHYYDVLRADRYLAANSLEARVLANYGDSGV